MSDAPLTPQQMKAARELLGWSQMDVANRVGLTEWVIGFFERGERLIRARYLRRMVRSSKPPASSSSPRTAAGRA